MQELVSYVSRIFIAGLTVTGGAVYGGVAVYGTATSLARDRGDRLRYAFEIDRETARGIHEIENYLARRDTPA